MKFKTLEISKIKTAKYNPRVDLQPNDRQYKMIAKSLAKFGLVDPLIWNEQTGQLVGGHQRLKILKASGHDKVQVSVVDLNPQDEKELNLSLNKNSGEWDIPKLETMMAELKPLDRDFEHTGFERDKLEAIMSKASDPEDVESLLNEAEPEKAIDNPIWVTVRAPGSAMSTIEAALSKIKDPDVRVEKSYE